MHAHRLIRIAAAAVLACPAARAQAMPDCTHAPAMPLALAAAEARVAPCNREVLAAASAVDVAQADVRIAAQGQNPTLTVGANNINPRAGVGAGTLRDKTLDSSVRIEQLVERGGKMRRRVAQARASLRAARADLAEQVRQQRLAMRTAFYDLAAAQARVALQREFVQLAEQAAAAARRRLDAGEIARNESSRFRLDAARAANDLRQAELDRQRARAELARSIGAPSLAASIEAAPEWPGDEPPARLAGERADVAALRSRVAAAEEAWELSRLLSTRDVTVGVQADRWPVSESNPQGTGTSYGFTLSIPLFLRHANEGEAARAMGELTAARLALDRALLQAEADRQVAAAEWQAARERRARIVEEMGPTAREVAESAEFAYRRGAAGVLELLDARRSLKSAELDELQARFEAARAWARFAAATEPYEEAPDAR